MQENIRHRREHQPKGYSIGSIFKRRKGYSNTADPQGTGPYNAEELIKQAGCEIGPNGWREEDVYMAEANPNYFINENYGTYESFANLACRVYRQVKQECGIELEMEADIVPHPRNLHEML